MKKWESQSADETFDIAGRIASEARSGDIFCLTGELGAGKTVFAKGFAAGIGIKDTVTSPTFSILNVYSGQRGFFYHFDVYRISDILEMEDTGYEDYFYGNGICLIEWADIIKDIVPEGAVWIRLTKDFSKGEGYRLIEVDI